MSQLRDKAYIITEDDDGECIVVFSKDSNSACEKGAKALNVDTVSSLRTPHLDKYFPGPVSLADLVKNHGWWSECSFCESQVTEDNRDIRPNGPDRVFCSEYCECMDHMEKRYKAEAREALLEVFEAKFPGATIGTLHVYKGPKLQEGLEGSYRVMFSFPGSKYLTSWDFGAKTCSVPMADLEAFKEWRKNLND